jgi:hypothetical protein
MTIEIMTITILLAILTMNSLFIGYLIGRSINSGVTNNSPQSFFSQNKNSPVASNSLSIDDKKFVVDIKTDGLEKKYDNLGDIKQTKENISNSVNKLKNLKG